MTPRHESAADLEHEARVRLKVGEAYNTQLMALPISYKLDYLMIENNEAGTPAAWLEVKARKMEWGQYPTIVLSLSKWLAAKELSLETGLPFIFAILDARGKIYQFKRSSDDFFRGPAANPVTGKHARLEFAYGGRTRNTRDRNDIEPIVFIPAEWFTELEVTI